MKTPVVGVKIDMTSIPQAVTTRPGTTTSANEAAAAPLGCKHTEVGVIPQEWRVSSIGAEFNIQLGKMLDAAKNVGIPKPYIGNRSVQWGRIDSDDIATVPMTVADLQRFRLRPGDLLVCEGGEIGRAAIWEEQIPECYYQKALHRLRTKGSYDAYLMMSLLQLWSSTGYLANYVTQTSIAHLPKDKLEVVPLPVPPPAEQRAIVEALSDVDQLLGSLEKLIAKKRAIKQAAMQQLLTGKTRLPDFSGEWETKSFGEVFKRLNGKAHQIQTSEYSTHGLHPVIDQGQDAIAAFSDRTDKLFECLASGVIVFGDHTRIVKFIDVNFLIGADGTQLLTAQGHAVTKFFFYQLLTKDIPNTGYNRHFKFLQDLTFEVPTSEEQKAIAAVLFDMDAEIAALEHRRDKARAVKQGMMQQLLTGRVRLVKPTLSQPVAQEIRG